MGELSKRKPTDILEPEGLSRSSIDRPIKQINSLFAKAFGWPKAPIQTAADLAMRQGRISIGDIGCGSGNTLRTLAREVSLLAAGYTVESNILGVNRHDYSNQSASPDTLAAIANRTLKYIVADATNMPFGDNALDVSLAYKSIEHCIDPESWMKEMLRVTRPGGVVFFTADTLKQFGQEEHPLPSLLCEIGFESAPMIANATIETDAGNVVYMTLGRLVVPTV